MAWDRRGFLQLAGVGTAACVTGGRAGAVEVASASASRPAFGISYEHFRACEGRDFMVAVQTDEPVSLRLREVVAAPTLEGYPRPRQTLSGCFTLVFESEQAVDLVEAIHAILTPEGDTFAALVSPLGNDGRRFQVVFNRI
jgi:hypothetical protein